MFWGKHNTMFLFSFISSQQSGTELDRVILTLETESHIYLHLGKKSSLRLEKDCGFN